MGVPVTFFDKFKPDQFELIGSNRDIEQDPNKVYVRGSIINGKETFKRSLIPFCLIMCFTEHLAVLKSGCSALAPCSNMVCIHFF